MLIAIDPGSSKSGFVSMTEKDYMINFKGKLQNDSILDYLKGKVEDTDTLVIEKATPFSRIPKVLLETCVWMGRFIEAFPERAEKYFITRVHVRMYICGTGRSNDAMVRAGLIDRFGEPGTNKKPNLFYDDDTIKMAADVWQAYALGVTYSDIMIHKKLCDPRILNAIERIA